MCLIGRRCERFAPATIPHAGAATSTSYCPRRARSAVTHHAALPYAEIPAFMAELRSREGISARALELTILTAVRTGEALGARWSEVDTEARVWTIPADRMKAREAASRPAQ